jgi:hypothetical protein
MQILTPDILLTANCRPQPAYRRLPAAVCFLMSALFLIGVPVARAQAPQTGGEAPPPAQAQEPESPPDQPPEEDEKPLPGDWAVALLDRIANSPVTSARDDLFRSVMAVGPGAIPMLEPALQDDRTAEFAAQALAFIGGEKALKLLGGLESDKRDLNLRRFYYGSLAEFSAPEATAALLEVIKKADSEPDRTVTEVAIVALTVRADPAVLPELKAARESIQDLVIQLDLESAIEVISRRANRPAVAASKSSGSIEAAVRNYFAPALESAPPPDVPPPAAKTPTTPGAAPKPPVRATPPPSVKVRIENVAFSPNESRALARVIFEDPSASAIYDFVLQKLYGDWTVASVWPGAQIEKTVPEPAAPRPKRVTEPPKPTP